MTLTCPGCGFVSGAEARYCRMCGTQLPRAAGVAPDAGDQVSPHADTAPLRGATEDISPHDTLSPAHAPASRAARNFEESRRRADEVHARLAQEESSSSAPSGTPADAARMDDDEVAIRVGRDDDSRASSAPSRRAPRTGELAAAPAPAGRDASRHQTTRAPARASGDTERRALRLWLGMAAFGAVMALCVAAAVLIGWYMTRDGRFEQPAAAPTNDPAAAAQPAPAATEDAKQQAAAKLAEAEQLLAAGRRDEAVARLRDAASLDPADAEPRRRLARLLLESGARRTAIEELRAVLRIAPNDAQAWRELAQAQAAEGFHRDAAESYRRLFEASAEARRDDRLQLSRADALLRAGRESEARAAYERLASSRVAEVARASRRQLARLGRGDANANGEESASASASASPSPAASRDASAAEREAERSRGDSASRASGAANPDASRAATPAAQLSPRERYERGVRLWQSNRAAAVADFAAAAQAGQADANYYLGLNLVEGRAVTALSRGQLVAAMNYFQRARRGRHAAEARRREEELGREYDRRRAENRQP